LSNKDSLSESSFRLAPKQRKHSDLHNDLVPVSLNLLLEQRAIDASEKRHGELKTMEQTLERELLLKN